MSRKYFTVSERKLIKERAKHRCEYCQILQAFSPQTFHNEHIEPVSKSGNNDLENMAFACGGCNLAKSNKTEGYDIITRNSALLYHPRKQKWEDHFAWNEDYTLIIGLTPTGRATVERLNMNRFGLINLRRVLYGVGEHPPTD